MSETKATIDSFERSRVCVRVTRSVNGAEEQMSQTHTKLDPDDFTEAYRVDAWSPLPEPGPVQSLDLGGTVIQTQDSPVKSGGRWYILDVPDDVALAIRDALNDHYGTSDHG